jgi:hypothetical protein
MSRRADRIRRLQKALDQLDIGLVKAIADGQKSPFKKDQERAAWLAQHLDRVCEEVGAEKIIEIQNDLCLERQSEEVLDALEVILENQELTAVNRLVAAWRFLYRPVPIVH